MSHDGTSNSYRRIQELEQQNLLLRWHNLRLLEQLEKVGPIKGAADAVILIQVKQPGEQ